MNRIIRWDYFRWRIEVIMINNLKIIREEMFKNTGILLDKWW